MHLSDCQIVKHDSSLQRHTFLLLQSPMAEWFKTLQQTFAHCDFRLVCNCLAWEPSSWGSWPTVLVLMLLPEAVLNLVVSVATAGRQFLCATCFNTQQSHSVSLCGLMPYGWAVVAPRCFHLTIGQDLWLTKAGLAWPKFDLERWHLMAVPHWKSLWYNTFDYSCMFAFTHMLVMAVTETAKPFIRRGVHILWKVFIFCSLLSYI